jgi:hypothetical protein
LAFVGLFALTHDLLRRLVRVGYHGYRLLAWCHSSVSLGWRTVCTLLSEHDRWDAIRDGQAVEAKGPRTPMALGMSLNAPHEGMSGE